MSYGANVRIGFWTELLRQRGGPRGVAGELLGLRAAPTVTPSERCSSNAIV